MADEGAGWLGVDLGTQSVRVLLVTADGRVLGSGSAPLSGRRDGVRHEQDPERWWSALCTASRAALGSAPGVPVGGLAVCGTSGTVLLTDGSGRPGSPALMYDDGRAAAEAARAREAGLAVQDTWALPKALWLLGEYGPGLRLAHQPDLVVTRLTGEPPPADSSHALKTGYDLHGEAWPEAALARLGVPPGLLPDVVRPGTHLGEVSPTAADATGIPAGTKVLAGMTDGCAAQIASGALRPGSWNSVLGTTLVLKGATCDPVRDPTGVVYNHRAPDGTWLPGGASSVGAGALTAHFPDADPAAMDERAAAFEPSRAVAYPLVSPGERFPFRAPDATPLVLGEPEGDAGLWAALLQGVGFAERLCLDYLHHLGAPLDGPLTFTGGGARSRYWNQLRADILGRPARIPEQTEPALGMAALAAYGASGAGALADVTERMVRVRTVLEPRPDRTAAFAEPYARLVEALRERGWLPAPVAEHALTRLHVDTGES
ncbi:MULTISPECIES: FGGY-family carbohydrate kinase [Streptomyces]|uniref:Xylulose kinase n=1 Tax=Streptomyces chartreusis NRRL 3882 TaxID=1079985 RepID=A0A2N9BEQ9_STRCX|nr:MULTISPECIES: FGGY-family carbohydrate kinase [Streptomyces]MYS92492.1 carbohydrate kinase [Streptomyces sp. SID5464]SOR81820.1 Xylulose kinase [Streptomyces chartreusis NRRL 3882]